MADEQEIFDQSILKIDTTKIKLAITIKDVEFDDSPILVADPFLIYHNGKFFIFYELQGKNKKVIAVSESNNGLDYRWLGVVLDNSSENILSSFPYVFKHGNDWYMIPEQSEKKNDRSLNYLYKTNDLNFPFGWNREGVLFDFGEKRKITDKSIIRHNGMWYVFYGLGDSRRHKLNIAMFEDIENRKPKKHPASPIMETPKRGWYSYFIFILNIIAYKLKRKGLSIDDHLLLSKIFSKLVGFVKFNPCRPAGKIVKTTEGKIVLYLQDQGKNLDHWDIRGTYGKYVSAMIINKLTPEEIVFRIHSDYTLSPTFRAGDWNSDKMHTFSLISADGKIFAAVDGFNNANGEWSIGITEINQQN